MSDKTLDIGYFKTGSTFETIVDFVQNDGPDIATGVQVNITVPDGIQYSSHSVIPGTFNSLNHRWDIGTLNVGQVATASFVWEVIDSTVELPYVFTFSVTSSSACDTCLNTAKLCLKVNGIRCTDIGRCDCSIKTVSSETYLLTEDDRSITIDASSNNVAVTLLDPDSQCPVRFKVIDLTNSVTLVTPSGKIVDNTTVTLSTDTYTFTTVGESVLLQSDADNWYTWT